MSYVARILPPEEWSKLAACGAPGRPALDPLHTRVAVVEADGRIVGTVTAMRVVHVHFLWIDPAHRQAPGVWRRLWLSLQRIAVDWQVSSVLTEALPPGMDAIVQKLGGVDGHGPTFIIPLTPEGALWGS